MIALASLPGVAGGAPADSAAEVATDSQRGRKLLSQYQCGSCHAIPGVPAARGRVGPSLQSFGLRSYIAGVQPNNAELLQRWIVQPHGLAPGTAMPSMGVSPGDARDIAAYLMELR